MQNVADQKDEQLSQGPVPDAEIHNKTPERCSQEESTDSKQNCDSVVEISASDPEIKYTDADFKDIFKQFILLGWTAFGGPSAHIALFQKIFIDRLKWMSESAFLELFALGQCLPGPTSTQVCITESML